MYINHTTLRDATIHIQIVSLHYDQQLTNDKIL